MIRWLEKAGDESLLTLDESIAHSIGVSAESWTKEASRSRSNEPLPCLAVVTPSRFVVVHRRGVEGSGEEGQRGLSVVVGAAKCHISHGQETLG